ncbi:MAG: tRNA (adenosine(37)-N6)-dimethylallyltransferase MiaA [Pelolinea sp.]|nr:tRNA (adenosine(37)-N6)-dimethylallyltransferase MiaA [Pelolinea sp.]
MQFQIEKPLILIVGPTGVGKTEISIKLAEDLNGEIISVDSRLFYRGMDIGTAKPTIQERNRISHHLIDVSEIDDPWSLAVFQEEVYRLADEIRTRGKIPFLVGGTGQYIRAIIEGWSIPPQEPDFDLRNAIRSLGETIGAEKLFEKLQIVDPDAAERIEPRNLRRTVRAFEVIFSTGKLFSAQKDKKPIDFQYKLIGLSRGRQELYQRIDDRIENMFETGFIAEVETILKNGYRRDLPSLSAIGYKEVIAMLCGEIDSEEAIRLMKRRTRQYVRRQANWFKSSDPKINWFEMEPEVEEKIKSFILSQNGWENE